MGTLQEVAIYKPVAKHFYDTSAYNSIAYPTLQCDELFLLPGYTDGLLKKG